MNIIYILNVSKILCSKFRVWKFWNELHSDSYSVNQRDALQLQGAWKDEKSKIIKKV